MGERKDSSQTLIDTRRPLQLRTQTPHVSLYRRRLQLAQESVFRSNSMCYDVERIEAEIR